MGKAIEKMTDVAKKADVAMDAIKRTSEQLADPQITEDIKGSVKSLRTILDGVANNKDGAAHKMIFDPEEGRRIDRILANLDATTANLAAVLADARDVTARAKTGPGPRAHARLRRPARREHHGHDGRAEQEPRGAPHGQRPRSRDRLRRRLHAARHGQRERHERRPPRDRREREGRARHARRAARRPERVRGRQEPRRQRRAQPGAPRARALLDQAERGATARRGERAAAAA